MGGCMGMKARFNGTSFARGVAVVGLIGAALATAPAVSGQSAARDRNEVERRVDLFRPGGSSIGASVRDLEEAEVKDGGGVYVASVRPDGPAAKAGLREADIITSFDGEGVRSVRQFSRLVLETPPGRSVRASVLRGGRATEITVTAEARSNADGFIDGDRFRSLVDEQRLQERLDQAQERIRRIPFDLNFDFSANAGPGRLRLGVTIEDLTPQLAEYFGTKDGVLVSSVVEDSAAARAGLKAGDVIISINGDRVASSRDLMRSLRSGAATEVTIGFVRDKKETSAKTRLEELRTRPGRAVVRPVRATPA
jgi:serine protease Do